VKRTMLAALLIGRLASAAAEENAGEPSALACNDFRAGASRTLASAPDTVQVNNLLFEASRKGCVGALDALFKAGASRLARDRAGNTALAIAAKMGRLPVVKALLDSAAPGDAPQLDRANAEGSTPLIEAASADRGEVAKWLVGAGAAGGRRTPRGGARPGPDVGAINKRGETALSAAAFNADAELASLLLAHKARPDTVDVTGKGVMVYAAARGAAPIAAMLLDAGVDPNARYRADLTALMWAAGHPDNTRADAALRTVELLLSRGAKVDLVDDRGRDALMIAAGLGHAEIAKVLLDAGADRTRRDKTGKSAIDLATAPEVKAVLAGP
jgi:ankyrin repeat protein